MNNQDYLLAIKKLFPREKNLVRNSLQANSIENMNEIGKFTHSSYKRSNLKNVKFSNSNLNYSAWTDSLFHKAEFDNCLFNSVNMQLCVFSACSFTNTKEYKNVSFCNSFFENTIFVDARFINCIFSDAMFINCSFINCTFSSSSFDGAKFVKCLFDFLVARNLNMDYSQYCECVFTNSQISLFQVSYTIGLIQSIYKNSNGSNNVFAFQGREISVNDFYSEYINYLIFYFEEQKEWFPLANILCFLKQNERANQALNIGIRSAIEKQNYRLSLHFAELIDFYGCFNTKEKREIIKFMNDYIAVSNNNNKSEIIKYSVQIENYLLEKFNSENGPVYYISIETNYLTNSKTEIVSFISDLDELLSEEQGVNGMHSLKVTHNSPLWLDIIIGIGCSVVGAFLKDGIDKLIDKIKILMAKKRTKIKSITIKAIEKSDGFVESINSNNHK